MESYIGPEYQPSKVQNQTPFSISDHTNLLRESRESMLVSHTTHIMFSFDTAVPLLSLNFSFLRIKLEFGIGTEVYSMRECQQIFVILSLYRENLAAILRECRPERERRMCWSLRQ